jgi:ABC transporter C-terminal domain
MPRWSGGGRIDARIGVAPPRRTRGLKARIGELEAQIEELERLKAGLEADFADPATYAGEVYDAAAAHIRHGETSRALAAAYEEWTDLQARLEAELETAEDA